MGSWREQDPPEMQCVLKASPNPQCSADIASRKSSCEVDSVKVQATWERAGDINGGAVGDRKSPHMAFWVPVLENSKANSKKASRERTAKAYTW